MPAALAVSRLGYALGARVEGVDLARPVNDATIDAIRSAWMEHLVLCFPNQEIGADELVAFGNRLGRLDDHRAFPQYRHPDHPEVMEVRAVPIAGKRSGYAGRNWHTDLQYTKRPALGTLLFCKECPTVGGDTMFSNMYLAYETLSRALQGVLDGLAGVHDITLSRGVLDDAKRRAELAAINPPVAHPIVRTHPETGRKALFVSERVRKFVGMSEAESRPILDFINRHSVRYEFLYRHRWHQGDLIMWDNRCLNHIALGDFDASESRIMLRSTLLGPEAGEVFVDDALG